MTLANQFTKGTEYLYPDMIYPEVGEDGMPVDSLICEASYTIPGPFNIKKAYTPSEVIQEHFNYEFENDLGNVALHANLRNVKVTNVVLTMDVFDYMYHDSPIGPFAEEWTRDPESVLTGHGDLTFTYYDNSEGVEKQVTLRKMEVKGTLKLTPDTPGFEWLIGINSQDIFMKIHLLLGSHDILREHLGQDDNSPEINQLYQYYYQIYHDSQQKITKFQEQVELPSNFGNNY